jgi:hypothetical protein
VRVDGLERAEPAAEPIGDDLVDLDWRDQAPKSVRTEAVP